MNFLDIIYYILIMPLKLFFEIIYVKTNQIINNPGLSIIVLSLMMNILVLPLYKRADAMQEEEQKTELKLSAGIKHIKKTFKGDERMMMLQTYYRQNNYKPTDVFKSSISLFLEIPFFIAAYQFLSHLGLLKGVSLGVIRDLGAPDGLITFGNFHINVLPFVMTGVNLISCAIFTKGYPLKSKLKLYLMALFFLVFLYTSPSGLVFYWTLNNIFSLGKTIVYKISDYVVKDKANKDKAEKIKTKPSGKIFAGTAIFITLLIGFVIPSEVVKASPTEFADIHNFVNPLWYLFSCFCIAFGTFFVWIGVFYKLAKDSHKASFEVAYAGIAIAMLVDYMFFGKNLGKISSVLQYEFGLEYATNEIYLNFLVVCLIFVVVFVVAKFFRKYMTGIFVILSMALAVMSTGNAITINKELATLKGAIAVAQNKPQFSLSRSGKNVVVIMLDRAIGAFVPYLLTEKPEIAEMYSGFTYFPNVVSFSGFTIGAAPALFGGYEYTPDKLNMRDAEPNVDKHNESLKVMPVVFDEAGFDVTVCDPVFAGYQVVPDLSIYDDYPDINTYITKGYFSVDGMENLTAEANKRNFFCFALTKSVPLAFQKVLYDSGKYNSSASETMIANQVTFDQYNAVGVSQEYCNDYAVLDKLDEITMITDENINTYMSLTNDTTHGPMLYQTPDYVPSFHVENEQYAMDHIERIYVNNTALFLSDEYQQAHYDANMAAILRLGEWLEFLKENGVYDNTRIIITSDHGRYLASVQSLFMHESERYSLDDMPPEYDIETYYPLLLVKDFDSKEFTVSDEFMTNADVPTLAMSGIIENPINPFTGNHIDNHEKYEHDQVIMGIGDWNNYFDKDTYFYSGYWFTVHDDMRNPDNWTEIQR